MATSNGSTPRHGGSHFSNGAAPRAAAPRTQRAAAPMASASTPRPALSSGRVSSRTAAATQRAVTHRHRDPRGGSGKRGIPLAAIAVVLTIAIACVVAFVVVPRLVPTQEETQTQLAPEGTEVTITIPDGSGAGVIAQILAENGLISDQSDFLAEVRRTEAESMLKSGSYLIVAGSDDTSIIKLLTAGPNASTAQLTIPEGYTSSQIAATVQDSLGVSADDFLAQAKASNYVADYPFLAAAHEDSLEGYLFPKTYDFSGSESVTADTVIRAMLDQYQAETSSIDLAAAAASLSERYGIDLDENDVLTMASIVEREAVTDEQRPKVASVFYNRLRDGMRLQSDATLTYSLGRAATAEEINTLDDPYNTNLYAGLTPTPVCSPSLASIEAACEPADTNFYYFFITQDTEQFSETYDQHMQAYS
ncbi:MAG TPA: endolytic transglycosylase MltG [Candidatus Olsenella excrementavium]|uniref:Endolytic murein transglycosylase n=1 Tax=Candidatus Olsenella excrementavium TaxID=2838709 RepID=A0A9D2CH23_9ACTN|nr:endolytic transglycosylase MltG [Candidatus Olsenella excrementavium]